MAASGGPPATPRQARRLLRSKARTFYLASLFLPIALRRDIQTVYSYYRTVDDLVDEPPSGCDRNETLRTLALWDDVLRATRPPENWLQQEVLHIIERHAIPTDHLLLVLDGMRFDLEMRRIDTMADLITYSGLVAGSVGVVMAHILGATDGEALAAAHDLGVAMQITNVVRDVGEDLLRGRIYLPLSVLAEVGCTLESLEAGDVTPAFRTLLGTLIEEARRRYTGALIGIAALDNSAQFAIYLAAALYARILDKVEQHDFDVFQRRAHLGTLEKWQTALPVYLARRHSIARR